MALKSLRARLLLWLTGTALIGVVAVTAAAIWQIQLRGESQARSDFTLQISQLQRSLDLRRDAFTAISDLSYVLPVFRQVAAGNNDDQDFGLGTAQDDATRRAVLHQNLVDADWSWTRLAGSQAFVAVADGQGRLLFTTSDSKRFGDSLIGLSAVDAALSTEVTATHAAQAGGVAMVVDGGDAQLQRSGLLPPEGWRGMLVVLVRATFLGGIPKALYLQGIRADDLLRDVGLSDAGSHIALLSSGGVVAGNVPPELIARAGQLALGEVATVDLGAHRWLVGRHGLGDLGNADRAGQRIAQIIVARDLDTGLAILLQSRTTLLLSALLALGLAALVALWQAHKIAAPVRALDAAARRVAQGDLEVRVQPTGEDEIGRLGSAFGEMVEGLKERRRLERTFKRYLAPDIVDYLLSHPEAQLPGGDRRALTVSFADLSGFTEFSESHAPEKVVEILNTCLSELAEAINHAGGTVDKFMGDNCMAFFGAPIPRPDHAVRACRAALRQVRALTRLSVRGEWPSLGVRVGINTGDMIVGTIGGAEAQDYTVVGDAVNLAARLEPANKVYGTQILCTQATVDAAEAEEPGAIRFRQLDTVRVQGKREPIVIWEVTGTGDESPSLPGPVLQLYAEGLGALRLGRLEEAKDRFEQAALLAPHDGPSRIMARRTAIHLAAGTADPDGVFSILGK